MVSGAIAPLDHRAGPLSANMSETARPLKFTEQGERGTGRAEPAGRQREAVIAAGRLVAYLVERARARVFFVFRTAPAVDGLMATIVGSPPGVNLLFTASTARAVRKAMNALRFLRRQLGAGVDAEPPIPLLAPLR